MKNNTRHKKKSYLDNIKKIIDYSNVNYKFKGDKKTTFDFTNSDNNSVDYSQYLNQIPKLIDIGYDQNWLYAVADKKSAMEYLIKKQNDIISLNKIGIDSGKMMRVYKSQYPYITTGLLAKNIHILQQIQLKTRNIFLDKVLKATTIGKIEQYFKRLNQNYNKKTQNNKISETCAEHDDNTPLLPNSKDPVLTQAAFPSFHSRTNQGFGY